MDKVNDDVLTAVLLEAAKLNEQGNVTYSDYSRLKLKLMEAGIYNQEAILADTLGI